MMQKMMMKSHAGEGDAEGVAALFKEHPDQVLDLAAAAVAKLVECDVNEWEPDSDAEEGDMFGPDDMRKVLSPHVALLKELDLSGAELSDSGSALALPLLTALEELDLSGAENVSKAILDLIGALPSLKSLDVHSCEDLDQAAVKQAVPDTVEITLGDSESE